MGHKITFEQVGVLESSTIGICRDYIEMLWVVYSYWYN